MNTLSAAVETVLGLQFAGMFQLPPARFVHTMSAACNLPKAKPARKQPTNSRELGRRLIICIRVFNRVVRCSNKGVRQMEGPAGSPPRASSPWGKLATPGESQTCWCGFVPQARNAESHSAPQLPMRPAGNSRRRRLQRRATALSQPGKSAPAPARCPPCKAGRAVAWSPSTGR